MRVLTAQTRTSLKRINWRLYLALLITASLPTIYTTTRIYFLGDLPTDWGVNIASQLAWINLGLEVVQEAIVLPLFFLLGKSLHDRAATINKLTTGLVVTLGIYIVLTGLISAFAKPLVTAMAQHPDQIPATVEYIRLEMERDRIHVGSRTLASLNKVLAIEEESIHDHSRAFLTHT